MKNNQKLTKIVFVLASLGLILAFGVFVLEKTKVTNFYSKPIQETPQTERPVNDVQYTPANSAEQEEGEQIKQNLINQSSNQNSTVNISFSAAGQDEIGGPLIVKAVITGTSSGECKLALTNASETKTYRVNLVNLGSYFGCDGFSIPINELSSGKWTLTLGVNNKTISEEVEIKK